MWTISAAGVEEPRPPFGCWQELVPDGSIHVEDRMDLLCPLCSPRTAFTYLVGVLGVDLILDDVAVLQVHLVRRNLDHILNGGLQTLSDSEVLTMQTAGALTSMNIF